MHEVYTLLYIMVIHKQATMLVAVIYCLKLFAVVDDCCHGGLRGVAGRDGKLGCLCGKAGTSHVCDGSTHSSECVVNGSNAMAAS